MFEAPFPVLAAWMNAAVLASAGLVHLAGVRGLRELYAGWDVPTRFYLTMGILEIVAASFLVTPDLRLWGIALAAIIAFGAVVMLLDHGHYLYALPVILFMFVLVPAALAIPHSHEHIHYAASIPSL